MSAIEDTLHLSIPVEIKIKMETVRDIDCPTYRSRLPDKYLVNIVALSRLGRRIKSVTLRSMPFSVREEAHRQYMKLISDLM